MNIQIIKQFSTRTEYKMLKEWANLEVRNIEKFATGICVIPAIVLLKLSETELRLLNNWWRQWGNQLIISPPFHQMDIVSLLQLNIDLSFEAVEAQSFKGLPIIELIKANVNSKWEFASGKVVAVDYFEHSGSGCVTLTTVPLLDYRLLSEQENCKKLFLELLNQQTNTKATTAQDSFTLCSTQEYFLILSAADALDPTNLSGQLSEYFNESISNNCAIELFQQLIAHGFLEDSGVITRTGEKHIHLKGYWAFVREIKRWRHDYGAWR